jgi:uncharacterized SAM-dependent methyltransferase
MLYRLRNVETVVGKAFEKNDFRYQTIYTKVQAALNDFMQLMQKQASEIKNLKDQIDRIQKQGAGMDTGEEGSRANRDVSVISTI